MREEIVMVRCGPCGARNRIPKARLKDRPICGKCRAPLVAGGFHDRPVTVTDGTFADDVLAHAGPVLVDCWAPWCGPCRTVGPILDQLASEYAGQVKIGKLNVDENPLTASKYGIQSIPTLLLFQNGREAKRLVGALPKGEIERILGSVL